MMTDLESDLIAVTCLVEPAASRVEAGAEISLRIRVSSDPPCDFEGEEVVVKDEEGALLTVANLPEYDDDAGANVLQALTLRAPTETGRHVWTVEMAAQDTGEVRYDLVEVHFAFTVTAHRTHIVTWDVPQAIAAGESFSFKVGLRGSGGCSQAGRKFRISDAEGNTVAEAAAGPDIWPKSAALYVAEVTMQAPQDLGSWQWTVQCDPASAEGADGPVAHDAGSARFGLRTDPVADCVVRTQAWDTAKDAPLAGARVLLPPYSAVTDEDGFAEVKVPRGSYRLFVTKTKFTSFGAPVEVEGDLTRRVELSLEPPPNRE